MISQLTLKREHTLAIIEHSASHAPLEACGLLAGKKDRVEKVLFVRNQAQSPARFVMDPYEQLQAFDWIESNRLDLLAIFHSHPAGPETVSPTDIAEAAYEVVHIVCFRRDGQWSLRGFWIEKGTAREVDLKILE